MSANTQNSVVGVVLVTYEGQEKELPKDAKVVSSHAVREGTAIVYVREAS